MTNNELLRKRLPSKFVSIVDTDKTDMKRIDPLIQKYLVDFNKNKNNGVGIVSYSQSSGVGKSFDLAWLLIKAEHDNFEWITPHEIIKMAMTDYSRFDYWLKKCGILIVDDFGKLYQKHEGADDNFYNEALNELFLARDDNMKSVFITTNFTQEELIDRHGNYIVRRIFENAGEYIITKGIK